MRTLKLAQSLVVMVGLGTATMALASSIPAGTYDLAGASVDGYQLTGSVTVNSSGAVSAADVTLDDSGLGDPVFSEVSETAGPSGYNPSADYALLVDPGVGQLGLYYLTGLNGSGDVDLCIASAKDCNAYQASYIETYNWMSFAWTGADLNGGTLDAEQIQMAGGNAGAASAATPEPGSLALVGTGILGLAWMTRKRKRYS